MSASIISNIGKRLYRSIPLIPVFSGLFVFIAVFSPMSWTAKGPNLFIILGSVAIGVICAYCVTMFVEEYTKVK